MLLRAKGPMLEPKTCPQHADVDSQSTHRERERDRERERERKKKE